MMKKKLICDEELETSVNFGETMDCGISSNKIDDKIITEMSPRSYLFEKGITVHATCKCHGGDELGQYEIRLDPQIFCEIDLGSPDYLDTPREVKIITEYFESIWSDKKYDDWTFKDLEPTPYFSEKIDLEIDSVECSNLEGLEKVEDEKFDFNLAFDEGFVNRFFYPTAESCFADFKKIFEMLYSISQSESTIKYAYDSVNKVTITKTK